MLWCSHVTRLGGSCSHVTVACAHCSRLPVDVCSILIIPSTRELMEDENIPLIRDDSVREKPTATTGWRAIVVAIYCSLVVCLGGFQFGFLLAFSSPFLDDFQTHLPLNFTVWSGFNQCVYQDLVGPIAPAGAFFGSILSSPVVAVTGFVTGLVVMSLLFTSGWLLIAVSFFIHHGGAGNAIWFKVLLFLGRVLTGVGAGWAAGVIPVSACSLIVTAKSQLLQALLHFTFLHSLLLLHFSHPNSCIQVYIGEVSPPAIRGRLGALFEVAICAGTLLVYLLGTYISYWQLAFVCTAISVVQLVLMFTIRESPRLSRNPLNNIHSRLGMRQSNSVEDSCSKALTLNPKPTSQPKSYAKSNVLRIMIVCFLLMFQAISGVDAITSLAGPIFRAAGLDRGGVSSGLLASLTIGVVMTIFTILALFVVDRFGRRLPLFFGGLALMVANIGMSVYFAAAFGFISDPDDANSSMVHSNASIQNCVSVPLEPSPLATQLSPLPIASVCFFFASFSLSWGPVPWIIGGELFPDQIREVGMGISAAVSWVSMIVAIAAFPVIGAEVGQAIPFLTMAVISLLSSIFVVFFLAETKGLELDQISSMEVTNVKKNVKEFGLLLGWLLRCGFVRKIDLPHYQG